MRGFCCLLGSSGKDLRLLDRMVALASGHLSIFRFTVLEMLRKMTVMWCI